MTNRCYARAAIGFLISAFCLSPPAASADPIVVTSGGFGLHTNDPTFWTFAGDGFVLRGGSDNLPGIGSEFREFQTCCRLGEPVDFSAHITRSTTIGELHGRDPVRFNGVSYSQVFWTGDLRFDAPPVVIPAGLSRSTDLTAPFTFSGQLSAFADPSRSGAPLFSTTLVGTGQATFGVLVFQPGRPGIGDLDFVFGPSASPVPEPATFVLLSTGFAAAIVRRRRAVS
jgi:hypothetical protein